MSAPLQTYLAWMHESSGYTQGWVAYPIEASSRDEAEEIANRRFVGTQGFWTLEIDKEPIAIVNAQRRAAA